MPFKLIRKPRTRPSTRVEFQPTFAAQARFRDGFSLIAALGFFLVAASVAAAADPPPNHDRAWWSNSPPSDSSEVTPKATEYGPATAASSTPQSEKTALLARTGQTAEGAPTCPVSGIPTYARSPSSKSPQQGKELSERDRWKRRSRRNHPPGLPSIRCPRPPAIRQRQPLHPLPHKASPPCRWDWAVATRMGQARARH